MTKNYRENGAIRMSKKITVEQLNSWLTKLIEDGCGHYTIDISVHYDNCDHIQPLDEVCANISGEVDFITLRGR